MGFPSIRQLMEGMSSTELTELMAYFSIEPFGQVRDDLRVGYAFMQLANTQRTTRRQLLFKTEQFTLSFKAPEGEEDEEMTDAQMWEEAQRIAVRGKKT